MYRHRLLLLVAVAGLAAAGTALAASSASVFTDPSGDSGAAPDLTEVQVGNDDVAGPIVLWITAANRTSLGASEGLVTYLDTDLNGSTGNVDFGGAEFGIETMSSGSRLYRLDGANRAQTPAPSLRHSWFPSQHAARIEIQPRELGGPRAFNFYVVGVGGDAVDLAPDGDAALWSDSGPRRPAAHAPPRGRSRRHQRDPRHGTGHLHGEGRGHEPARHRPALRRRRLDLHLDAAPHGARQADRREDRRRLRRRGGVALVQRRRQALIAFRAGSGSTVTRREPLRSGAIRFEAALVR